jgi:hypothetical protein
VTHGERARAGGRRWRTRWSERSRTRLKDPVSPLLSSSIKAPTCREWASIDCL